ncbi:MAG: signal peptidase I [Lachnospiraceae bacterium]|nr:signal peptidase I [Lachnospiraceae bacterium]
MILDYDFDRAERIEKRKKFLKKFFGWVLALGAAIALAWAITTYALEKTNMVGDSMEATLSSGDTILIDKLLYRIKSPERFDVIVFKKDGKEHSYYSIKRIIGLPGEHVLIADGKIYIDGVLLEEETNVEDILLPGLASDEILLDGDEYFVLGDNRNNSEDSRFFNVGNVFSEEIIGRAWIRLNRFGLISKLNMRNDDAKAEDAEDSAESADTQEKDGTK